MEILLTAKRKVPNVTNKIIVTNNLSPYELLDLKKQNPKGLISGTGSISSHISIVAKNLNLPSIVGVKNATLLIKENAPAGTLIRKKHMFMLFSINRIGAGKA